MACFLSICRSEIFYWCPSSLWSTFIHRWIFWGGRSVWDILVKSLLLGPPQFGAIHYAGSTHAGLIILGKYGPARVQLILLGEREKIRIRVSLSPTGVTVHAVLLFKGRMICREMRDEEELPHSRIWKHLGGPVECPNPWRQPTGVNPPKQILQNIGKKTSEWHKRWLSSQI